MTEFKPGDRVKVEYEGRVVRYERDGFYTVYADYSGERHDHENYLTLLGPEEPTGVGAVVRDAKGMTFARHSSDSDNYDRFPWVQLNSHDVVLGDIRPPRRWAAPNHNWDEICANVPVEVLYEGVQP